MHSWEDSSENVTVMVTKFKGIFTDFNNLFLWHESEDIKKKTYFQNFS